MKCFRLRHPQYSLPASETIMYKNCDSIISEIESVFSLCGAKMSAMEKKQILAMLQYIEKHKKCIKRSVKKEMYEAVNAIWNKYQQNTR